jgi:rRNA N6-adenosine-methyltransferase METTL5
MMKIRQLESLLSGIDCAFVDPKVMLEQYPTSAHIAAHMIHLAAQRGDIENSSVLDIGIGTGMLSIASIAMGSSLNVGVDVDIDALTLAQSNIELMDVEDSIDLVNMDIQDLELYYKFDTVVMNPPFGTRNAGIDTLFVKKAMEHSNVCYSLHKTSTRSHFDKLADENGWSFEVCAELNYELPKTMKHHKDKSRDIKVDLYRFAHTNTI